MKNVTYINAGAGSGKTYTLVDKLTKLVIEKKANPEQVILTTFTTKAADEFKERAKAKLYEKGLFKEAVQLDQAMIGTVHSVCEQFITKYWFYLGLPPAMNVMTDDDSEYYLKQSLAKLPEEKHLKFLRKYCEMFEINKEFGQGSGLNYDFWQADLSSIINISTSFEIKNFAKSQEFSVEFMRKLMDEKLSIHITDQELEEMLEEATEHVKNDTRIVKKDEKYGFFDEIRSFKDRNTISCYRKIIKYIKPNYGAKCKAVCEKLKKMWRLPEVFEWQEKYIKLMFFLASKWKDDFAQYKRERNLLDYNDMEKYMRQLLENEEVKEEIRKEYKYLFVDEFQDSSPIQVKIFDSLSELMEQSWWVGDSKQAIYGFRGSDIELVNAVVEKIKLGKDGCKMDAPLKTNYRSLEKIVKVNNAVFKKTFKNVPGIEDIELDPDRKEEEQSNSLRYFITEGDLTIGKHVAKLLAKGAKRDKIAVLARKKTDLNKIANDLAANNITTSWSSTSLKDSATYKLVQALLRLVNSSRDTLARATVAKLTEKGYTTRRIIEEKLVHDKTTAAPDKFMEKLSPIERLMKLKPRLENQSISMMVESLIIEMNLSGIVKRFDGQTSGTSCLQTIIKAAAEYEQYVLKIGQPASIEGFLSYVERVNPKGGGDKNGVQLLTYHKAKGLQWDYVILTSLHDNPGNQQNIIKKDLFGVHFHHVKEPTSEKLYPEMLVRLLPWVYIGDKNLLKDFYAQITVTPLYKKSENTAISEANRLMYVGMTRARDVLILHISKDGKNPKPPIQWFEDIGVESIQYPKADEDCDLLGTGMKFANFTITSQEMENLPKIEEKEITTAKLSIVDVEEKEFQLKNLSPSRIHEKGKVVSSWHVGERIPFGEPTSEMATVGDCVHQIFATMEDGQNKDLQAIIGSFGLEKVLTDPRKILQAWETLVGWLAGEFGKAVATYHERPFRMERNGQSLVGDIDFVWETQEGTVLIDFKTCPMGESAILDENSDHYAGWYAGQLNAYTDALEGAGETVLKRLIYYPVSGIVAEIGR